MGDTVVCDKSGCGVTRDESGLGSGCVTVLRGGSAFGVGKGFQEFECLQLKSCHMPKWHILGWYILIPFSIKNKVLKKKNFKRDFTFLEKKNGCLHNVK